MRQRRWDLSAKLKEALVFRVVHVPWVCLRCLTNLVLALEGKSTCKRFHCSIAGNRRLGTAYMSLIREWVSILWSMHSMVITRSKANMEICLQHIVKWKSEMTAPCLAWSMLCMFIEVLEKSRKYLTASYSWLLPGNGLGWGERFVFFIPCFASGGTLNHLFVFVLLMWNFSGEQKKLVANPCQRNYPV